ncbi:hypothetical protein J6590_108198 [Homalodisca vitripennis]|nr:hypothetical protein J6590_108288 [Homalodisca vitripennis]KAG8330236.1 hypothetical protein J6590_108198 [Homalodisca vitripennis]
MATSSKPNKRSRNVLSIESKLKIIEKLEKGETGTSLAKQFNVGKATISEIKSKKSEILKFASKLDSEDGSRKRKSMKRPQDEKLEEAMYLWFIQRRTKGEPISGPLLCEKAIQINKKLGGSADFKASTGWLKNFKSRHGIRELDIQGEILSGDSAAAEKYKETFSKLLKDEGYSLDLVYNADETGLNWKALPRKSLASKREKAAPGFKVSKERVTIMVAANATGTHALPLLMISKSKKPRCFKNVTCLPLTYKSQKNAWMNCEIFLDWFTNEFIPDVKKYKKDNNKLGKVLLVIDNAPTHPDVEILNSIDEDFKVTYLPPNVTALLQPMDQGVIEKLKRMYKKQVLRRLLLADANEESVVQFAKKLNVKDCSYMIADSWSTMKESNLKNAWNKILEKTRENIEPKVTDQEDVDEFLELYGEIPGFSECDIQDTEDWLTMDNDPGFQILNDEEIVSLVLAEDTTQHDSDEDCNTDTAESTKNRPSHEEAFSAFNTAMSWLEKQEESCPTQLLLLKRLRDLAAKKRSSSLKQKTIKDYFTK